MGGGGGTKTTTTSSNAPAASPQVSELMSAVLPNVEQTFATEPLSTFLGPSPTATVPLSAAQIGDLQTIQNQQNKPLLNAPEVGALGTYANLIDTQPGASPATLAAETALEEQYNRYTLPSLQNEAAKAGLGKSGALTDAIANARSGVSAAEVPLLQSDIANEIQGAQGLTGYGQLIENLPTSRAQSAFDAAEIIRQSEQAPLQQQLQDYLNQEQIISGIGGSVTGFAPSLSQQQGFTVSRTSGGGGSGIPLSANVGLGGGGGLMSMLGGK